MAQPDPIDRGDRDDRPVGAPGGTRHEPQLQFPRRDEPRTINVWRTSLYFVLLVIVLAAIVYFIVRPR